ncbi:MAG: sigma 54-interacting transcriptional regulator [Desulfosarcinaceae bacterium]|nr:sigma 54-interacting transcriptional regulator [Desulfosarcinaceae bacterium]
MNPLLKQILAARRIAHWQFDADLNIVARDRLAKTMPSLGNEPGGSLLAAFPELVGSEDALMAVIRGERKDLRLEYVNRNATDGDPSYWHLMVLADRATDGGILLAEEVSKLARLQQAYNQQRYEHVLLRQHAALRGRFLMDSILGDSPAICDLRDKIKTLSKVPTATVLLLGESGTGKNLTARVIHHSAMPPDAPLVEINCGALPDNLIEAELFGVEKGAFTHATASRVGLLEEAAGGSIFLDEIGELPLNLQAKLLSALESKTIRRLGSNRAIRVNVRIIAATNRDLQAEVAAQRFREDLFYRLNVVSLTMPPLRTLGEDILTIAHHLLAVFNMEFKKKVDAFTAAAEEKLRHYHWPGNVRELSNCIERAMIFAQGTAIDAPELILSEGIRVAAESVNDWSVPADGIDLDTVERQLILSALERAGRNKSKAARLLGLSRDTLRYRLEKYNIT